MRTTLDIDDALLQAAARRYPPGTPKTVLIEEGLRQLAQEGPRFRHANPIVQRWIEAGLVRAPTWYGPLPRVARGIGCQPLDEVLGELDGDRADR